MVFLAVHLLIIILFVVIWLQVQQSLTPAAEDGGSPGRSSRGRFLVRLFFLALGLRLLAMLIFWVVFPDMFDPFANAASWSDSLVYHDDARALAGYWRGDPLPMSFLLDLRRYVGYPTFLAGVYYIFGPYYLVGTAVNILLGILTCFLTYWLGREVFDEDVARQAAVLLAVFPLAIYFCCFNLKDPLFQLLLVVAIFSSYKAAFGKWSVLWLVLFYSIIFLMLFIRYQASIVLFGILLIGLALGNWRRLLKVSPVLALMVAASFQVYGLLYDAPLVDLDLEKVTEYQTEKVTSMKSVTPELEGKTAVVLGSLGYFLPFPTLVMLDADDSPMFQLESSIFLWNLLAGASLMGIWYCLRRDARGKWFIWAPPLIFFVGEALVYVDTILDIRRSKFMILPFACILGIYGLREWKSPARPLVMVCYLACVILGSLLYTYYRLSGRGML
uniref:Glycosyltransferase RgtA/B/C/D-like domain-containing protein n=1 Tax=Desulfobacca acetoxidans TaxID=60893 RepID=A0A7V4LCZ5_9BACT